VSNPKGIVFFVAVLPQFADRSAGHVPLQMLLARTGRSD
jgi:threonine/homoserine/homoserine lactone efflux protein